MSQCCNVILSRVSSMYWEYRHYSLMLFSNFVCDKTIVVTNFISFSSSGQSWNEASALLQDGSSLSIIATDLKKYYLYEARVSAENNLGSSEFSDPSTAVNLTERCE